MVPHGKNLEDMDKFQEIISYRKKGISENRGNRRVIRLYGSCKLHTGHEHQVLKKCNGETYKALEVITEEI